MEIKELRLGNTLLRNTQMWNIDDVYDMGVAIRHPEIYKPILLTEDWLKRAGFIGETKDFYVKDSIVLKWGQTHSTEDGWLFHYGKSFASHMKYVHQLQNLFYDLTHKELIVRM